MSLHKKIIMVVGLLLAACSPTVTPTAPVPPPPPITVVPPPTVVVTNVPAGDAQFLPRPDFTPGYLNPDVTQDTISTTICVPGYSSSIRPPVSYTDALKVKQIGLYGYTDTSTADYEEDHFIPLSVGGNPTDPRNLWPQPRNTQPYNAAVKDTLEYTLYKDVCSGKVSLADAQAAIVSDWVAAYRKYVSGNLGISLTPEP